MLSLLRINFTLLFAQAVVAVGNPSLVELVPPAGWSWHPVGERKVLAREVPTIDPCLDCITVETLPQGFKSDRFSRRRYAKFIEDLITESYPGVRTKAHLQEILELPGGYKALIYQTSFKASVRGKSGKARQERQLRQQVVVTGSAQHTHIAHFTGPVEHFEVPHHAMYANPAWQAMISMKFAGKPAAGMGRTAVALLVVVALIAVVIIRFRRREAQILEAFAVDISDQN